MGNFLRVLWRNPLVREAITVIAIQILVTVARSKVDGNAQK